MMKAMMITINYSMMVNRGFLIKMHLEKTIQIKAISAIGLRSNCTRLGGDAAISLTIKYWMKEVGKVPSNWNYHNQIRSRKGNKNRCQEEKEMHVPYQEMLLAKSWIPLEISRAMEPCSLRPYSKSLIRTRISTKAPKYDYKVNK